MSDTEDYVPFDRQSLEQADMGVLTPVFRDGKLLVDVDLRTIRERLGCSNELHDSRGVWVDPRVDLGFRPGSRRGFSRVAQTVQKGTEMTNRDKIFLSALVFLILALAAVMVKINRDDNDAMLQMVKAGYTPIEAMCAVKFNIRTNTSVCFLERRSK
jgi:hypothetical protein